MKIIGQTDLFVRKTKATATPDDPDPNGPFSGPIWQEGGPQIPTGNLAELLGAPDAPGMIIDNWTTDQNGNVIGETPNEQLCGVFSVCMYWDTIGGEWNPTERDEASTLANTVNKTGIQSLANPCSVGLFYGASAVAGGVFTSGETLFQAGEAATTYWPQALTGAQDWFYQQSARGFSFIINFRKNYNGAKDAVVGACNAME
ncbi:MAG: hypothetical protein ACRD4C_03530 [Candidatus Acidiferrales bacterium]